MNGNGKATHLSHQCQDTNLDHHGYCDGTADDGDHCECRSCQHPD